MASPKVLHQLFPFHRSFVLSITFLILCGGCTPTTISPQESYKGWDEVNIEDLSLEEFREQLSLSVENNDVDAFWDAIETRGSLPLVFDSTVLFLYRGEANSVTWLAEKSYSNLSLLGLPGARLGESNIWMVEYDFPEDARWSYRIRLDNREEIIDPLNPNQIMESSGLCSELRMPAYVSPDSMKLRANVESGTLSDWKTISSDYLGYEVVYQVYAPSSYNASQSYPSLYFVDGQDYAHRQLGQMKIALDNLISDGLIEPVIAIFIDSRDPHTVQSRRLREYLLNPVYIRFLEEELVPAVEKEYQVAASPDQRGIIGMSEGGILALYTGISASNTFRRIGAQSPYPVTNTIIQLYAENNKTPISLFISVGTIGDMDLARLHTFKGFLDEKKYDYQYMEINDGPMWGNYKSTYKAMFTFLFSDW
jgi:enterochelin esterase-like enzyme